MRSVAASTVSTTRVAAAMAAGTVGPRAVAVRGSHVRPLTASRENQGVVKARVAVRRGGFALARTFAGPNPVHYAKRDNTRDNTRDDARDDANGNPARHHDPLYWLLSGRVGRRK